jgi:hypothetical protein
MDPGEFLKLSRISVPVLCRTKFSLTIEMGRWIYNAVNYKGNWHEIPQAQGQLLTRSVCKFFFPQITLLIFAVS